MAGTPNDPCRSGFSASLHGRPISDIENTPKKRRPGRIAQAVAVNCGYWTKAIALKRKPGALHFCSLILISSGDARQAGLLRRQASSLGERIATRRSGTRETANGEVAVASQAEKTLRVGATRNSKARCPRPQSPHVRYNWKNLSASVGSTSFPVFA